MSRPVSRPAPRSRFLPTGPPLLALLAPLAVAAALLMASCDESGPTGVAEGEEVRSLDVTVHLLRAPGFPAAETTLGETGVEEIFRAVNEVWSQAAVEWRIDEILIEEARGAEAFQRIVDREAPPRTRVIAELMPTENLADDRWHVFFIGDLGGLAGGIYFPGLAAVLQPERDPSGVRGLDGGLVRILAHELGHGLSLPHVPCRREGNLMAPGCREGDRGRLTEDQVEAARSQALEGPYRGGDPFFR